MVPGDIDPSIVQLSGHCALTRSSTWTILVSPFPVQTPGHPGPNHHVFHHVRPEQPSSFPQSSLCLLGSLAQLLTNTSGCAIDLKAREGEIVRLRTCVPPILLDPDVSHPASHRGSTFNLPGGCASRLTKPFITSVLTQHHPVDPIPTALQLPAAKSTSSITSSMPQGVSSWLQPDSKVDGKPCATIVVGVAVQGVGITTKDVLQLAIGQTATLTAGDHHKAIGGGVHPVISGASIGADPVEQPVGVKVGGVCEGDGGLLKALDELVGGAVEVVPLLSHHLQQVLLQLLHCGQGLHLEVSASSIDQTSLPRTLLKT